MALAAGLFLFVSAARLGDADDEAVDIVVWRGRGDLGLHGAQRAGSGTSLAGSFVNAIGLFGDRAGDATEVSVEGDGDQGVAAAKVGTVLGAHGTLEHGEAHTGIIIWPKVRKKVVMMPSRALYPKAGLSEESALPLEIPFNGVY